MAMKKETLQMIGIIAGILVVLLVILPLIGLGILWMFPAQILFILGFADSCLRWAADRQIPVWVGAFALQSIASHLWSIRFNGLISRRATKWD